MTKAYERLLKCYQCFKDKINFKPEVALVLGSGLGDYADTIRVEAVLDYHDIEGFPVSTVSGHKGRFVFGYVGDVPVVIMQGRVHYYEGYSMEDVCLRFTVRTFVRSSGVLLQTFRFRFRREPISSCPVRILKLPMK